MLNILIYPFTERERTISKNPYLEDLKEVLSKDLNVLDKNINKSIGILEFLIRFRQYDILYLNWIEDLPDRKFGIIQALLWLVILNVLKKGFKKKIIYTVHNRFSHTNNYKKLKKLILIKTINNADLIITHSIDGISFIKSYLNDRNKNKLIYFPHPTKTFIELPHNVSKEYDILIWGTVYAYKGILEFLNFLNNKSFAKLKILIFGKFTDQKYYENCVQNKGSNVLIINDFLSDELLYKYMSSSNAVLFNYNYSSVFSSSALMDTLRFNIPILGPKVGALLDIQNLESIFLFDSLGEFSDLYKNAISSSNDYSKRIKYLQENSWNNFAAIILQEIENI